MIEIKNNSERSEILIIEAEDYPEIGFKSSWKIEIPTLPILSRVEFIKNIKKVYEDTLDTEVVSVTIL